MLNVWQRYVTDDEGNVIDSPEIEVRDEDSGDLIPLFSDVDGNTSLGNPFTGGSDGFVQFYASAGRFKITVTKNTSTSTFRYVQLGDTQSYDTGEDPDDVPLNSYIRSNFASSYQSKSSLEAATVPASVDALYLQGYTSAGDGGGALYKRVASEPSHAGKIQSNDGAWWEIAQRVVTPKMFGAAGDGSADDRAAVQNAWYFAADNNLTVDMMGLEYNCSEAIYTRSNLNVIGQYAVMYITAWPSIGSFVSNVVAGDPAARVQSNIRLDSLIFDGSKLSAPTATENSNLLDFARGASHVRVTNCISRKIRDGFGGGTGGGAFGVEQGGNDIEFINCVAEDCYRAFRVAGLPGDHADAAGESKRAINVRAENLTVRRCGTAVLAHAIINHGDTNQSDLGRFDCLIDGLYIEDSGHYPWRDFDFSSNPGIDPQKTGAIVLAGAQNVKIRDVRVKLNSGYPDSFTDWLGRTGYPAADTDHIGEGLSGSIGALVWGWGRNVVIDGITLDGSVDAIWKCHRAVTFGEIASISPTDGTDGSVQQNLIDNIRFVRGSVGYIFDGQSGLDNSLFSAQMILQSRFVDPSDGVIGPDGTSGLSNLLVKDVRSFGGVSQGNAVQWLAFGNAFTSPNESTFFLGGIELGGGYAADGSKSGLSYDGGNSILRSSKGATASSVHAAFYNPNGNVGQILTSASSTSYTTSSDARLKEDLRKIDGLATVNLLPVYDFAWKSGGRGVGGIAQEWEQIFPDAVSIGDDDVTWGASVTGARRPWSIDYSKVVPLLIEAVQQLSKRVNELEGGQ